MNICDVCPYNQTTPPCTDAVTQGMNSCCDFDNLPLFEYTVQLRAWRPDNGEEYVKGETTADTISALEALNHAVSSFNEDFPDMDYETIRANVHITGMRLLTVDEVHEVTNGIAAAEENQAIWWRNLSPEQVQREKQKALKQDIHDFLLTDEALQVQNPVPKAEAEPFPYPFNRDFDGLTIEDLQVKKLSSTQPMISWHDLGATGNVVLGKDDSYYWHSPDGTNYLVYWHPEEAEGAKGYLAGEAQMKPRGIHR